mmetsp:Transcript_20318/g.19260  ORF Transcript_20318/g.19260 Transcript_20318/m.19260 type:complete len:90 (-) Transcript_20318:124-393(-)
MPLDVRLDLLVQLTHLLVLSLDNGSSSGSTELQQVTILEGKDNLCNLHSLDIRSLDLLRLLTEDPFDLIDKVLFEPEDPTFPLLPLKQR